MAKVGRKRKLAKRHPSGQIVRSRELEAPFRWQDRGLELTEFRDLANQKVTSYKNLHVSELAKLFCERKIKAEQLAAGGRFYELWHLWRRLFLQAPRCSPKAANLQGGYGHDSEETQDERQKALAVDRSYCEAVDALFKASNGRVLARAVEHVVCWDREPSMPVLVALGLGLSVLAEHFGLDK